MKIRRSLTAVSSHFYEENDSHHEVINEGDWKLSQAISTLLEPFNQATEDISSESFGISSETWIIFNFIEQHIIDCLNKPDFQLIKGAIHLMSDTFNYYWPLIKKHALICHMLNPV